MVPWTSGVDGENRISFMVGTNKVYGLDVSCKTKRRVKMFGLSNWKNGVLVN